MDAASAGAEPGLLFAEAGFCAALSVTTVAKARVTNAKSFQRLKLNDGGHEAQRFEQQRDAAVRCSALGIITLTVKL